MNRTRQAFLFILLLAAGLGPEPLAAQPKPTGPERRVDTDWLDYSYSYCPQIGVAPDRSFEIAWSSGLSIPNNVRARHYNANGSPTDRYEVAISPLSYPYGDGDTSWVVAVTPVSTGFRVLMEVYDESDHRTFARRRIDSNGVPAPGAPRPVGAPDTQWVAPGPGDVLFAGRYDGARRHFSMQKVDSLGKPAGKVYVLNTRPFEPSGIPIITPLSDGGWVAVFLGFSAAGPGSPARQVIRARRFNAAGDPLGPDFDVNSIPGGRRRSAPFLGQNGVFAAAGPSGQFAVAWGVGNHDYYADLIRVRFFNSAGFPVAPEATVVQDRDLEGPISMAFDSAGRLLLVWQELADLDPAWITSELLARLFRADGSPVGAQFRVRSAASSDYVYFWYCSSVVWTGDSWLITWLGHYLEDSTAIFLRRFR